MGVTDQNIPEGPDSRFSWHPIAFFVPAVANSQADVLIFKYRPGFSFEVMDFETHVADQTDTTTLTLKKGTTTILQAPVTPVDDDQAEGAIVTTAARFGTPTDELNVHVTTDGTGDITELNGRIWIRRRAHSRT